MAAARPAELQPYLLDVIVGDMAVPPSPDELADRQAPAWAAIVMVSNIAGDVEQHQTGRRCVGRADEAQPAISKNWKA